MMPKLWPFGKKKNNPVAKADKVIEETKRDIEDGSSQIIEKLSSVQDQLRRSRRHLVVEIVEKKS